MGLKKLSSYHYLDAKEAVADERHSFDSNKGDTFLSKKNNPEMVRVEALLTGGKGRGGGEQKVRKAC